MSNEQMKFKGTPGPWVVRIDGTCSAAWPHIGVVVDGEFEDFARCKTTHLFDYEKFNKADTAVTYQESPGHFVEDCAAEETLANARLIAAAPELLADLEVAAAQLRQYEALHRAKGTEDSLAKAEVNSDLAGRFEATINKALGVQS